MIGTANQATRKKNSGNAQSTTQAAISGIAGNTNARTGDKETGIQKIFDADKVQKEINAQVLITQTFGREAPRAAADFAVSRGQDLNTQAKSADKSGDTKTAEALRAEAQQWGEGGAYRIALQAAVGGLAGGVSGALGAGAISAAAPLLTNLQNAITQKLKDAGASDTVAQLAGQAVSLTTAAGIGAAAGGGNVAGVAGGLNVDANNRQLHSIEIDLIKKRASDFAKKLKNGGEPTPQEIKTAEDRLFAQAQRLVDATLSDYKVDVTAINFLRNEVARDATISNGGRDPLFFSKDGNFNGLFTANPNDFFNSKVYSTQGDPVTRAQALQAIARVYSDPNAPGVTNPNAYLGSYLDYANLSKAANQVGKDGALCLTGLGCLYVNARNFKEGVDELQKGNTNVGWSIIGLSIVGGGASATLAKQEVAAIQNAASKTILVSQLRVQGIKVNPDDILAMSRLPDGRIVFLESGSGNAGFQHILDKTESAFAKIGVTRDEIPKILINAINEGKVIGFQGVGTGRPIYETTINGSKHQVAITVGDNGYIVGATYKGPIK